MWILSSNKQQLTKNIIAMTD